MVRYNLFELEIWFLVNRRLCLAEILLSCIPLLFPLRRCKGSTDTFEDLRKQLGCMLLDLPTGNFFFFN